MIIINRYSIEDSVCGEWRTASTKRQAINLARDHVRKHDLAGDHDPELPDTGVAVTVFDHMSRFGQPQKWMPDDTILEWQVTEDGALGHFTDEITVHILVHVTAAVAFRNPSRTRFGTELSGRLIFQR